LETISIDIFLSNRFRNLIKLYRDIGFRYSKEKEVLASYCYEYLLTKKRIVNIRRNCYRQAVLLKKNYNLTPMQIFTKLKNDYISYKNIAKWLSPKERNNKFENIKVPNSFPSFEEWLKKSTKNLKDGLVWETIEDIKEVKTPLVYDLTTDNSDHNFFANGFLVSNSGREDRDALCLGWRPFIIELLQPKKRKIDLKKALTQINKSKKIKVKNLKFVDSKKIAKIKELKLDKTYRALIKTDKPITKSDLNKLKSLIGVIKQRTPIRVRHRRADLTRKRIVKQVSTKYINKNTFEMKIKTSAGLYVKELISGDKGRTKPSVSEILGVNAICKELDVINISKPRNI